jgi:Zn-dependent M28 family amino/carboxypeptidase
MMLAIGALVIIALLTMVVLLAGERPDSPGMRTDDVGPQAQVTSAYGHLKEFQALADEHGDRAAGTSGHEAAAEYVEGQLASAGYETTRQYFTVETRDEEEFETFNVIAETEGGDEDNVIMLGAHLDGVPGSPAINDNASGSAALLEVARRLGQQGAVGNKVRFAWWGAEEYRGFPGSTHYVEELDDDDELETIAAYLNFDMVASPNAVVALYDARQDHSRLYVPEGSRELMEVFTDYFDSSGQPWITTSWNFESDQVAFAEADIPVGGLFSGSNERKSSREARLFGGEAGVPRDPNYHQPGDDLDNIDPDMLDLMTDAITHAATRLAQDTGAQDAGTQDSGALD